MPPGGDEGPRTDDREGIARLRSVFRDAGYTPGGVHDAIATEVAAGRDSAETPLYLRMLEGGGALATLIKLFLLDVDVPVGGCGGGASGPFARAARGDGRAPAFSATR